MMRKKMVTALSLIYIINGFWDIGIFLYPLSISPKSIQLDLAPLISGVLALYVGFYLLKFDEFGRKLAIFLLCARVAINSYFILWFLPHRGGVVRSGLYFLEKEIYRIANPYASEVFLIVWILLALLAIFFLSQRETKKIFMPVTNNGSDTIVESPNREAS